MSAQIFASDISRLYAWRAAMQNFVGLLGDRGSWLYLEQQSARIAVRPQFDRLMDSLADGRSTTSLCAR